MASRVAEQLRDGGKRVLLHCGGGSFKSQMKRADASQAHCAVIIGEDEVRSGLLTVKPLRGGEQVSVALADLAAKIDDLN